MLESVREWTPTLPLWELESWWTLESSKSNYRGQNPFHQKIPYIIRNLLECKFLKWARMTHLNISNTSYGQKKGRKSNWQFDSHPLKVKDCPNFLVCRWCVTYHWKALDEGYNFSLDLMSMGDLRTKLWAPKVLGVPTLGILGLPSPLGSPRTKWHLDVGPVAMHRVYYKREGGGLPQVRAMVSFVNPCSPVTCPCTKVLQLCINQLVVWFV